MPWLAGFGLAVLIATVYLAVSYAKRNRDPFQSSPLLKGHARKRSSRG